MTSGALIDPTGRYRYWLMREVEPDLFTPMQPRGSLLFVMLNPSTADHKADDPTIRRCIGFAKALGYPRLEVVNLFAFRATDPEELHKSASPIGPENDRLILEAVARAGQVIAAWGASVPELAGPRARAVTRLITSRCDLYCLGRTRKGGAPRHPLYLPASAWPQLYAPKRASAEVTSP